MAWLFTTTESTAGRDLSLEKSPFESVTAEAAYRFSSGDGLVLGHGEPGLVSSDIGDDEVRLTVDLVDSRHHIARPVHLPSDRRRFKSCSSVFPQTL